MHDSSRDKRASIYAPRLAFSLMAVLAFLPACSERDKPKNRYEGIDGGYVLREECNAPSGRCQRRCIEQDRSATCSGCCRDQRFLCDTQKPYSFEACDDVP